MMKKIRLFAMLMGILTVFAFTGCTSGTDGNNGGTGTDNGAMSGIERTMDDITGKNSNNDITNNIRSGIHTNPEYSGVAYGGGYANLGK